LGTYLAEIALRNGDREKYRELMAYVEAVERRDAERAERWKQQSAQA
jgi:hypothetical protein